jgi:hypothetical protein
MPSIFGRYHHPQTHYWQLASQFYGITINNFSLKTDMHNEKIVPPAHGYTPAGMP